MKQTINFSQFLDGFAGSYKNNFSYKGKRALFDYLEELEESSGEEIEFDPISLCCEYAEYDSALESYNQYRSNEETESEDGMTEEKALEWLNEQTQVIEFDGGIIIQEF